MTENEWTSTIEAMREVLEARDKVNAPLLGDNVNLEKKLKICEDFVLRLGQGKWPSPDGV